MNPAYVVTMVKLERRWRRPRALYAWPDCPQCGRPVDGLEAMTMQGRELSVGGRPVSKEPDEYVGHRLLPCRHRVQCLTVGFGRLKEARP